MRKKTCKCGKHISLVRQRSGQRYCLKHHAEAMRKNRKKYPYATYSTEKKKHSNVRSYSNVYQKRGKITKQPCSLCGSTYRLEKHHPDYNKPLEVIWLCRKDHVELHSKERETIHA